MTFIALGFAVFYFSTVLRFSMDETGPYPQKNKDVALGMTNPETKERDLVKRPVGLFDYLRRFFGAYSVTRDPNGYEIWIVRNDQIQVWVCPVCLGFWLAFYLAVMVMVLFQNPQEFLVNWFAAAGINAFLIRILHRES